MNSTLSDPDIVPDAVILRRIESEDITCLLKVDMPCCDLSLDLTDQLEVIKQAGCPRCSLAYTVELISVNGALWARFTVVGPMALAGPRTVPVEGLSWHPVGERTYLVALDNMIIGVVSREGGVFTARRDGVSGWLPQIYESVEAAARAIGDVHQAPVSIWA